MLVDFGIGVLECPIDVKNENFFLIRYEETIASLQKIENKGYNLLSIWLFEFRILLRENPDLENELLSHPYLKKSPINFRGAMYRNRTEASKQITGSNIGKINYVDVISLYPYIFTYGKFP